MLASLGLAAPLLCPVFAALAHPLDADKIITCSNGTLEIGLSRETGAVVGLRSMQPTPLELLDPPEEPFVLAVKSLGEGWLAPLDRVRRFRASGKRVTVTVGSQEHQVAEAEVGYDLRGDFLRLSASLRWLTPDPSGYRIIWGQRSLPMERLYAYPYSEGCASTGGRRFLRLGSSGSVVTRRTFPADAEVDGSVTVVAHGLEPATAIWYRMQQNGDGYQVALADSGHRVSCLFLRGGRWTSAGGGLGSEQIRWTMGAPRRVRIAGRPEGFDVFLDERRVFAIQDTTLVAGAIGLTQGYSGECRVHDVVVRSGGQTAFSDDFASCPVGSEPGREWVTRAGFVEVSNGGEEWGGYPARFVDLPDRHIVWGQFDLNRALILNHIETRAPWVAIGGEPPTRVTGRIRGDGDRVRTFDLFLNVLPAPGCARRDAIRWYAQGMADSDPFFAGAPVRLRHTRVRTFPEGNFAFVWGGAHSRLNPQMTDADWSRRAEKMKALGCTNILLTDWLTIPWSGPQPPPADLRGAWFHPPTGEAHFGTFVRDEIARLKQEGFRVYLWCWPVTLFFNPRNVAKREAWTECVKRAVEFYEPDGIGYDMNWQVHKEILKLQSELFRWMHRRYPQKHIMHDYGFGTPSQLYAHSILSEFGLWMYGVPHNDVMESFTALRTNLTNLLFFAQPLKELREKGQLTQVYIAPVQVHTEQEWLQTYLRQVMESVAMGGGWAMDSFDFEEPLFGEVLKRTALAQFAARTTTVPLVCEHDVVEASPDDVIVSVWADAGRLLLAAYRYRMRWRPESGFRSVQQGADPMRLAVSLPMLRTNGCRRLPALSCEVLGTDAMPRSDASVRVSRQDDVLVLTGDLGEDEMLLVTGGQGNANGG